VVTAFTVRAANGRFYWNSKFTDGEHLHRLALFRSAAGRPHPEIRGSAYA
jgi:hypothetical protein